VEGEDILAAHMRPLAGDHVGFVVDAYTLHHKHMIAALMVTPHLDRDPLLVYLVQASNAQSSYAETGRFLEMFCRLLLCCIFFRPCLLSLCFCSFSFFPEENGV
jgi:hypothetical protein